MWPGNDLAEAYRRAARARRMQTIAGAAVLAVLIGLSAIQAEVDPETFLAKIGGFTSYGSSPPRVACA